MTQVWQGDVVVPVTRIQAGPCVVVQVKDEKKDGYVAVQVGYGEKKEKNIRKPQRGHMKKTKVNSRYLREFRLLSTLKDAKKRQEIELKVGDVINVGTFEEGDKVQVEGVSKGKGFQGVVKRHGFSGQRKTHGTKDQLRMPGSIGATGPAHVFKGMRMPGRMGGDKNTILNLKIIKVDKDKNELLIKGAVPGARNGLILISGPGELMLSTPNMPSDAKKASKDGVEKIENKKEEKPEEVKSKEVNKPENKDKK